MPFWMGTCTTPSIGSRFYGRKIWTQYYDSVHLWTTYNSSFVNILHVYLLLWTGKNFQCVIFLDCTAGESEKKILSIFRCIKKLTTIVCDLISQGMIKLYHIRYVDDLQWILRFVQKLYKVHIKTASAERQQYFNNFAMVTEYLFIVMTTAYLLSVFTFFPYPVYMYLFENEVVTIIPIYLPFVDHTQFVGYCVLGAFHIVLFIFATLGILACDFFMAINIISTLIFSKLISLDLQQIDIDCEQKCSTLMVKGRLRNVLLMHQEMIKWDRHFNLVLILNCWKLASWMFYLGHYFVNLFPRFQFLRFTGRRAN